MKDSITTPDVAIEFVGVVKRFGDAVAVAGIDLAIRRGELVTFLGPSGCGKTTSLRLIAGLELPSAGHLRIAGRDVSRDPASERNVGMVFQSYALFPHVSVLDNVAYGPVIRGVKKAEAHAKARGILDQIGLGGLHDRLRRSFRAASSSASRSRAPSPSSPTSSSSTSPCRTSTPSSAAGSARRSARCNRSSG